MHACHFEESVQRAHVETWQNSAPERNLHLNLVSIVYKLAMVHEGVNIACGLESERLACCVSL